MPFGTYIKNKQAAVLKHTVRAPNSDPLRQTALIPDTPFIVGEENRRVGRPRVKWVTSTYENIWVSNNYGTKQQWKADQRAAILRMHTDIVNRTI